MISKRIILLFSFTVILVSILGVCASDYQYEMHDIKAILDNTDESELTGCCSVVLQLEGNNSIFSFRRDASFGAHIYINNYTDWHGHKAIKQFKNDGGYFCQAVITEDGWTIGYGGIDDGVDNARIENITAGMINENNTISEADLIKVQEIKAAYGLGHLVIKAPNGNYGLATATTHQVGHLEPGEYISLPNKFQFFRSGTIPLNSSDKITAVTELAASDGFGLTRRDITTFNYYNFTNDTFDGNKTDIYLSNDDGSLYGMSTGGLSDDVTFNNNTTIKGSDLPIAPKTIKFATVDFDQDHNDTGVFDGYNILISNGIKFLIGFIAVIFLAILILVRIIRPKR